MSALGGIRSDCSAVQVPCRRYVGPWMYSCQRQNLHVNRHGQAPGRGAQRHSLGAAQEARLFPSSQAEWHRGA